MLELNLKKEVLHAGGGDPLIDAGADTEESYTGSAERHRYLRVDITLEEVGSGLSVFLMYIAFTINR